MSKKTHFALIVSAALGLGISGLAPMVAYGADAPESRGARIEREKREAEAAVRARPSDARGEKEYDIEIDWDKLPREVKGETDKERENRKVHHVYHVMRDGLEFYRTIVILKNGDSRSIRVQANGKLLSVIDVRQAELASYKEDPAKYYREVETRQGTRDRSLAEADTRVTATVQKPESIFWDQAPARVRSTILRENGAKVDGMIRYRDQGHVIYQSNLPEGNGGKIHMLQILPDGSIFNEGDFNTAGVTSGGDWRPHTVAVEDLPRAVRDVVNKEAPRGRLHAEVAKRRAGDVYTIEVEGRGGESRYLTIREDGRIVGDVTDVSGK